MSARTLWELKCECGKVFSVQELGCDEGRASLEARCAELEAALRRYGKHESECQVGYALGCTCGLAAALSADGVGGDE